MKKQFCFILLLSVSFLFFACENDKIQPGFSKNPENLDSFRPNVVVMVEKKEVTRMHEAVGTIRPLTESVIESQVSAKITKVSVAPGMAVKKGQLLVQLDARQLTTRFKQAKEALEVAKNHLAQTRKSMDEAKAGQDQAESAFKRAEKLFKSDIIASQKLEIDNALFLQAKARFEKAIESEQAAKSSIRKAKEFVKEAGIAREYTLITSPADGVVAKRMVDPGDIAMPGKSLLIIQTSGALRLEANVREGLISQVIIGKDYKVKIKTIEKTVVSQIDEILPYADPSTRTFLVKASLPKTPGLYPGMFGRLLIPVEKEMIILIPQKAIVRVGQLELVHMKKMDTWQSIYIKTGKKFNDNIEVLSGLAGNETIGYK